MASLEEERNHEQGVVEIVTSVGPVVQDTQVLQHSSKVVQIKLIMKSAFCSIT